MNKLLRLSLAMAVTTLVAYSHAAETITHAIPTQALALMSSPEYRNAVVAAVEVAKAKHLDTLGVMVLGYNLEIQNERRGTGNVEIIIGTTDAPSWPTNVYKLGVISAKIVFFPDGVNGFDARDVKFEALEKPETYRVE